MNNFEILQHYSKTDLRRLAKGKISEIVGLDADKILKDLSRVLGNYESVKRNVEFRNPPTDTILEVLLEADGHRIRVDDLKNAVRDRIRDYRTASKDLPIHNPARGYRLYATMLAAAWDHDGDLVPPEANLLRVLRQELAITRRDHQLIMAHPDVARLKFDADSYNEELTFLSNEGIVLVCCDDADTHFVLSDETAESLLQLWGFEMEHHQYSRLLEELSKPQLMRVLKTGGLRTSGSNSELAARILAAEIPPSEVLSQLTGAELATLLGRLGLQRSGNKEERVLRIIDYFRSDSDIVEEAEDEPAEVILEVRVLGEEAIADMLDELPTPQLVSILDALDLQKSGSKSVRIDRLVQSPFSSESILGALSLEEVRALAGKLGLRRSVNKSELIASVIDAFRVLEVEESPLSAKDLLDFYGEIASQDRRAYPAAAQVSGLSVSRIGLDFERATRHIFKNMLNLDTKPQRAGREEPDGVVTDDDEQFYCYECKTVLSPPYSLPIAHRLQIRNYVSAIAASRRADRFGGYLIIGHSFTDDIEKKVAEIQPSIEGPIAVIAADDLLSFAKKWQQEHPIDTYPLGLAMQNGRITARDLDRAGWR